MSELVLSARGLTKSYKSGELTLAVLRGVDVDVAAGESVSIRGESGSGKSTLLNLLAGLDAPDTGTVTWGGSPETGAARRAAYLGMIFQSFYLVPELDAYSNVLLARRILGGVDAAAKARAAELLNHVGLGQRGHHLPSQLSGGERQRVALARALMNRPKLIVADEPTGNLDERTGNEVIDLLLGLCASANTALILVTHNMAHAAKTSRSLHMVAGNLGPG
ncbi:MAG TPA: ABC transporter ATP-binding protein [Opitutaceae bacterium]|nr:ABC transporter ATP-binding protein [Opitutaceae bacterium]